MVRWCAVLGAEQCWVVLWTTIEDYGCITSHAQSTAAAYLTGAVKSDLRSKHIKGLQCERLLLRSSWPAAFIKPCTRFVRPATPFRFCIQLNLHVQTGQSGVGIAQPRLQQSDALLPAAVERPGPCDLEDENWEPGWASHGMQP